MSISGFTVCTQAAVALPLFVWNFGENTLWNPLVYKPLAVVGFVVGVPIGVTLDVLLLPFRLVKSLFN